MSRNSRIPCHSGLRAFKTNRVVAGSICRGLSKGLLERFRKSFFTSRTAPTDLISSKKYEGGTIRISDNGTPLILPSKWKPEKTKSEILTGNIVGKSLVIGTEMVNCVACTSVIAN